MKHIFLSSFRLFLFSKGFPSRFDSSAGETASHGIHEGGADGAGDDDETDCFFPQLTFARPVLALPAASNAEDHSGAELMRARGHSHNNHSHRSLPPAAGMSHAAAPEPSVALGGASSADAALKQQEEARQRRRRYMVLIILVGVCALAIVGIVVAVTAQPSNRPAIATAPTAAPAASAPRYLFSGAAPITRVMPPAVLSSPFGASDACLDSLDLFPSVVTEGQQRTPSSTRDVAYSWMKTAVDTLLSFGPRVAGDDMSSDVTKSGYSKAQGLLKRLMTCGAAMSTAAASASPSVASGDVADGNATVGVRYEAADGAQIEAAIWSYSEDRFSTSTPVGDRQMTNLIAHFNMGPPLPTEMFSRPGGANLSAASMVNSTTPFNFENNASPYPFRQSSKAGHVILSAHYDSKLFTSFRFVGACDSAVPAMMILYHMRQLTQLALNTLRNATLVRSAAAEAPPSRWDPFVSQSPASTFMPRVFSDDLPSVTVIMFDGEEAFGEWMGTDNTYGSRHLAQRWQLAPNTVARPYPSMIGTVDVMMLLDLVGPSTTQFHNYFSATGPMYNWLSDREAARRKLRSSAAAASTPVATWDPTSVAGASTSATTLLSDTWSGSNSSRTFFPSEPTGNPFGIEDDHIPWLQRGLRSVLHLISSPFPSTWHAVGDTGNSVDYDAVLNIAATFWDWLQTYNKATGRGSTGTPWSSNARRRV